MSTAVVGTGFIGPVHIEALRRLGRPLAGVLASSPDKSLLAAKRFGLPRGYASLDEILADPAVTAVHLASPNHLHYEQCKAALTAGKHVICEKPLALTTTETAELVSLARTSGKVAAVCYNVRFYSLCHEVRERIRAGEIGTVYHITGSYVQDWLLYDTDFNWRVLADQAGALRAVADIGTHWLDLLTSVTGLEVTEVCADLCTFLPSRKRPRGSVETFQNTGGETQETDTVSIDTEDYGSILLRFGNTAAGVTTVSQVAAGRKNCLRFEVAGSKGSLAWNSERPDELWIGHRDRPNELLQRDPALLHPAARPVSSYPGGHAEGFPDTFKQLFRAIYDRIDTNTTEPPHPFPTFEDGHREVVLCEAILKSHRERTWIAVR